MTGPRRNRLARESSPYLLLHAENPVDWYAWGEEDGLPVVALDTEPGDLTVHFGDAMHTTPPPTSDHAGRRALYYEFAEPKTFAWVPAGCHYNDALFRPDATGRKPNHAQA